MRQLLSRFVLSGVVHDLRRTPIVSSISRFHIQILQMFLFVFIWVHWDACLQYGACSAQSPLRQAPSPPGLLQVEADCVAQAAELSHKHSRLSSKMISVLRAQMFQHAADCTAAVLVDGG